MRKFIFTLLASLSAVAAASGAAPDPAADSILGVYMAIGEETKALSRVEFYRSGEFYEARIIWLQKPEDAEGNVLYDVLNPDPELRKVRADSIILVRGLRYEGRGSWGGGTIYNPVTGKTYDVVITFDNPRRLKVRGYMGSTILGKNFFWDKQE